MGIQRLKGLVLVLALGGCDPEPSRSRPASSASGEPAAASASAAGRDGGLPTGRRSRPILPPPDWNKPPDDAERTNSGLVTRVLEKGSGKEHPRVTDRVKIQYNGWDGQGKMYDTSTRGIAPVMIHVGGAMAGWKEGLQLMVAGEKRRMWIPAALAYEKDDRPRLPKGKLVTDVELVEVLKGPDPPVTPKELEPPADATRTSSGLAYKLLERGSGKSRPNKNDMVVVHYAGWTKQGRLFESTAEDGAPAKLPLKELVPGWQEGLLLMHVGDKMRLWIPAELAYGNSPKDPGVPGGDLVFDVELIRVGQ
jgi:peptidylprolyl isomerase